MYVIDFLFFLLLFLFFVENYQYVNNHKPGGTEVN
jgi:hypothetical protein